RDRFMADNVLRFVRADPTARVVVWAANQHVAMMPDFGTMPMGGHLAHDLGADYFSVGFAFGHGMFNAVGIAPARGLLQFAVERAPENTVEGTFARVGRAFVVGVRAPADEVGVAGWLSSRHRLRQIGAAYGEAMAGDFWRPLRPARAYNAMLYVDEISPSHVRHNRPFFRQPTLPKPRNLDFEEDSTGGMPSGWSIYPLALDSGYRAEATHEGCRTGLGCALVSRPGEMLVPLYGALSQQIDASPFRGGVVRVRAVVRLQHSSAPVPFAGATLWLRALDAGGGTLAVASTVEQPIVSGDWGAYEVSCRLPARASKIRYGVAVDGDARVWLDDVSVERVE
ncbi:MAG: uncharacterized protein JWN44_1455, partial [Myxococcales bacterium]|nr:uncharacterized protein [Myxococcales bacterium]